MSNDYYEYRHGAPFYDGFPYYALRQDVQFYIDQAKRTGGPVLEIGCGTGRVLISTARAVIEITGLDRSAEMLDICRGNTSIGIRRSAAARLSRLCSPASR